MKKEYYLLIALLSNTLFRFAPFGFYFGNPAENHTSFAVGQAFSWLFLLLYVKDRFKNSLEKLIFGIAFWCALSNLLDELFFDPIHLGWNEIVFAIFIISNESIRYYKNIKKDEQCTG